MSINFFERNERIVELRRQGLSSGEIAEQIGCSRNSVCGVLHRKLRGYVRPLEHRTVRRSAPVSDHGERTREGMKQAKENRMLAKAPKRTTALTSADIEARRKVDAEAEAFRLQRARFARLYSDKGADSPSFRERPIYRPGIDPRPVKYAIGGQGMSIATLRAYTSENPFGAPSRTKLTRKKAGARKSPEYSLHTQTVNRLKRCLPADAAVLHIPNARQGNDEAASRDRLHRSIMGVMKGAPDLLVIHKGRVLGLEMKASAGAVSDAQKWAHSLLEGCGMPIAVCRSLQDVFDFLSAHGLALPADKFLAPTKEKS